MNLDFFWAQILFANGLLQATLTVGIFFTAFQPAKKHAAPECGPSTSSPLKNLILFFSKDKNQIEKFPLSDFFPDYNLL